MASTANWGNGRMNNSTCIVFVIFTLQGNGAERVVLTLAKAMHRLGYDTHIICFKDHIDFEVDTDLSIHFFPVS